MPAIDALDAIIREELPNQVMESLPDMSPVAREILTTSMGVQRDGLGRNFQFIKVFETGLAGGYYVRAAAGAEIASGLNNVTMQQTPRGFPGYNETTQTAYITQTVTLKEGVGNIHIPHQYLRADVMTSTIGSVVNAQIRNLARRINHVRSVMLFTNDSTNITIGDVGAVASTVTNNSTVNVTVNIEGTNASGEIPRVLPGLLVDIYDSTGATKRNVGFDVVIDQWNPLSGSFNLKSTNQVSTLTLSNDDILVFKDSLGQGISGFESWIKNSGSVFGASLTNFPHLGSYLPSSVGSALTETILNRHLAKFYKAYLNMVKLDSILTTPGVTVGFAQQYDISAASSTARVIRDSALSQEIGMTDEPFKVVFGGKTFRWFIEPMIARGVLYMVKLGDNNVKRYIPPRISGTGTQDGFDSMVEWLNPLNGNGSIFTNVRLPGSASIGDMVEAPFVMLEEICPDYPQSIKLSGITEVLG